MRLRKLFFSILLLCWSAFGLNAQVTLFSENFNACALPAGWQVSSSGNQNPAWSVGISQNNDAPGQSIDGSCFLFIDDESEGNNTPGYVLSFTSPAFDASQHSKVELTMDVHYRDWDDLNDYLDILVADGTGEKLVSRFDRYRKNGSNIADHFTLKADLALLTNSPTARLIIRYSDGNGGWVWWAGVDNIKITGSGTGTNVVKESFNGCTKPAGWTTQMTTGSNDWRFGLIQQGSNALQGGNSMDGSCFAYFDDDALGNVASSTARLVSPWFDGTQFAKYELNYDVILRFYKEKIRVYVQNGTGGEFLIRESNGDVGGPYFPNYVHETVNLSSWRAPQMRVVFEYWDGNDWGWWAGVDNVKITGSGDANDLCTKAVQLLSGDPCKPGDNLSAAFDGPAVSCAASSVAGVWYRWQADFSGTAKLSTHAAFNDVVSIFTGSCAAPQAAACNNRDEHGFTGETTYFAAQSGTEYFIRISGQEGAFGLPRGELCVEIDPGNIPVLPPNDDCATAIALTPNGNCTIGTNADATMSAALPSLNLLARADLWYTFAAPALASGEKLEVQSNASFSDVITLYAGGCNALQEVAGNHKGGILELPALNAGQNYWVQIAGNFATVEGSLCPQLIKKQADAPPNDDCVAAIVVPIGGQCTAGSNVNASPSAYLPSCVVSVAHDVWFSFVAPPSGSVHLNTGADFQHVLALWQGGCSNLTQVFCAENPLRCSGFVTVNGLEAGQTYYVQIASQNNVAGDVCLKIGNGANPPDFVPLAVAVTEHCTGQDTAELQVALSGGVQPYAFSGNTNGEILSSGSNYLVIVTDAIGCEHSVSGIISTCKTNDCALSAAVESTNPQCGTAATGSITVTPAGGVTPYTYTWSNNATTASVANLAAGTYSVTITDAAGCSTALSQTLTAPPPVVVTPTLTPLKCAGDANAAINTTTAGGTSPYQYAWSNGPATPAVSNLGAGTYTLTVTDAKGCQGTVSQTVTAPAPITFSPVIAHPLCHGNANGAIVPNADGGTKPYQYNWSNNTATASVTGLIAGNYTLTLTDANDCTAVNNYTLNDPPLIQVSLASAVKPSTGGSNGAINVNAAGGTGTLTFNWFKDGILLVQGVEDLANVPAGSYALQVTDANGCMVVFAYTLSETVGAYDPGEALYAEVFPNPVHDRAVLAVRFPQAQTLWLILSDASGRRLREWTVENATEQHIPLDFKDLASGVYWLRVAAGTDAVSRMVVVEK